MDDIKVCEVLEDPASQYILTFFIFGYFCPFNKKMMKHKAPPQGTLVLKRKGHKRHHRKRSLHLMRWFWCFFTLAALSGGIFLFTEYRNRQNTIVVTRDTTISNMQAISDALERYRLDKGFYPPAYESNEIGEPTLSWRVAILPYFENQKYLELYEKFERGLPWNHEHNYRLLEQMPQEYRAPRSKHTPTSESPLNCLTNYMTVRHPDSVFPESRDIISSSRITDRLADTVAVIEVSDEAAIEWTKPDDFVFDPTKKSLAAPKLFQDDAIVCGMCNAEVKVIPIPTPIHQLFAHDPALTPEELVQLNPLVGPFLRNNGYTEESSDQPATPTQPAPKSEPAAVSKSQSESRSKAADTKKP